MLSQYKEFQNKIKVCLQIVFDASREQAYIYFIFFAVFSLLNILEPFALRSLINSFLEAEMPPIYISLLIFLFIMLFKQAAGTLELLARTRLQDTIPHVYEERIINKAISLDLTGIENSRIQDLIYKVNNFNLSKALVNTYSLFIEGISIIIIVAIFFLLGNSLIAIVTIALFLIQFIIELKLNKKVTKLSSEQDGENRLLEAIFELGTKIESNMEIRILLAKNFLFEKISNRKNFLSNILIVEERNVARKKAFPIIINITNQVLMYLIIGWVTISENKSIGNFVMLLTLFNLLNNLSQGILYKFNIIIRDLNIVDELIEFLSIHPAKKQKKHFISDDDTLLELKNVSYTYPFSSKAALKNINLTLGKGKTIAIVGANGSGKSTLAKIISGLLSPTNGKIYINDKTNFSAVFQNYMSYKLSLGENVRIGDIDKHYNEECVLKLFDKLNLNIPYDLDTQLGAVYGGIDLSGGQWQKIAIARGLWKTHNAIIFDEPTSALDAKSELFLINKFLEMAKGKTKIIITHRLAATKKADSIIVIEKGEIIEIGNHELLMNKHNSSYREMFDSQAKWYSS